MPSVIRGGSKITLDPAQVKSADFDYVYPFDLDLEPLSPLHDKLRDRVMERAHESRNVMNRRFKDWRKIDRSMTAYMPKSKAEEKVQDADERKPVSIVVPTSYANHQVLLTYHVAALLDEVIFKYEGVGPEDVPTAILMEHYIDNQARRAKMILPLHTMASDGYKYNLGVGVVEWTVKRTPSRRILRTVKQGLFSRNVTIEDEIPERILYEGNTIKAIDPYMFLPDVNFQSYEVQEMEYVGWVYRTNLFNLLKDERANPGDFFNVKYVQFIDGLSELMLQGDDARSDKTDIDLKARDTIYAKPVDVLVLFVDLIPSDWDLGDGDDVETWLFKVAGDEVIIDAGPVDLDHGMKPIVVMSPDYDGHSVSPPSRMEIDYPMQHAINFLYNAHVANVRKAVNNILAVDPGLVNYNDVVDTREGAVIRARKSVWGLGRIKDAVMQIPINDVTRQNMTDMGILMQLEDRVTGAEGAISGQINPKRERISSFESRQAALSALSRLEKDARIMYAQAYYDLAYMMAFHVIQLMRDDTYIKIAGRLPEDIEKEFGLERGRVKVGPELFRDLRFNVVPHDGTIPGSHNDPNSLIQFLQVIASSPEVAQQFDIVRIAKSIARRLGIKEVESFARRLPIQGSVLPNSVVEEGVAEGELVPVGGGNGEI